MRRSLILVLLLIVLVILMMTRIGALRAPGETTQREQSRIRGMSVLAEDI